MILVLFLVNHCCPCLRSRTMDLPYLTETRSTRQERQHPKPLTMKSISESAQLVKGNRLARPPLIGLP